MLYVRIDPAQKHERKDVADHRDVPKREVDREGYEQHDPSWCRYGNLGQEWARRCTGLYVATGSMDKCEGTLCCARTKYGLVTMNG
jgi:hypothetical protein